MEAVKLIFNLVNEALEAKAERRAEILARLNVEIENLQRANAAEDAAHAERTAETRRVIAEAPQPTVLVDPRTVMSAEEDTKP